MQKPVATVLNTILRETIPYYRLRLNKFELASLTAPDLTDVLTLKRTPKRFANVYVCPSCQRNFDVTKGKVLVVPLQNNRVLKLLVCHRCGEQSQNEDAG